MIVGMDWLSRFGAMIDCEGQRVVAQTQVGENEFCMEGHQG